jgi:hypothetical protein
VVLAKSITTRICAVIASVRPRSRLQFAGARKQRTSGSRSAVDRPNHVCPNGRGFHQDQGNSSLVALLLQVGLTIREGDASRCNPAIGKV